MANHISHAGLPFPIKQARFTVLIPYLDADGDPLDPTTPDTEFSLDGGAFADTAEEVTMLTGSRGMGYLTLSGAESNGSALALWAGLTSGPKATLMTLYPRVLPTLETGTAQAGAAGTITLAAGAAAYSLVGCIVQTTGGTGGGGTGGANNQARVITAYNTSTKVATIVPNWEITPSSDTTYNILMTDLAGNSPLGRSLRPTTDGATLDVTATGAAGIDWANIESPTATVGLTGTTVDLVANAVDATAFAPGAITNATFAAGAIDAAVIANATFDAEAFATGALGSVWDEAMAGHLTGGSTGASLNGAGSAGDPWTTTLPAAYGVGTAGKIVGDNLNATVGSRATQTSVDTVQADTDNLQTRLPATLVSGRMDASIGAMATDTLTGDALATSAVTEIQAATGTALTAATLRSALGMATANLDTQLTTIDDFLDTEIAAIKAKTDTLPADPADASDISTSFAGLAATLATIASYIDTEITAIKAKTDLIPASPAAVGSAMMLSTDALTATAVALSGAQKLADILVRRRTSSIEASGNGEALHINSLYGAAALGTGHKRDTTTHANVITVFQSDGTTELAQIPITTDDQADPIVSAGS